MKSLSVPVVLLTFLMAVGCGSGNGDNDIGEGDVVIDTDVSLPDTGGPDSITDVERDVIAPDNGGQDTGLPDEGTPDAADASVDQSQGDTPPDGIEDADEDAATPPENPWKMMSIRIEDEVVRGTSIMNPVDGMTFGFNPVTDEYLTQFTHDWKDPLISYAWHLDESSGVHTRKVLEGSPWADGTNFCMDEDWCQFIAWDAGAGEWIVMGPRSPGLMRIDTSWRATPVPLAAGDDGQPPNGGISYSHLFIGDAFFVYGWITGSGFSDTLLKFELGTADWSTVLPGLLPVFSNCLAFDPVENVLISVGGLTTEDGGETSYPLDRIQIIDLDGPSASTLDLPEGLLGREGFSCAIDGATGHLYVFGGAKIEDNWDERLNTYHNDLWSWDGTNWTNLIPDGPTGTFRQYGESWSLVGDKTLPNFGKNIGRMVYDENSSKPRLILMGDVPGTATQIYTLTLSDIGL
ncbi:MAG TPA: hypothetical protein PKH54_02075 [Myxococcota bacterium]|nr:hypothetical protein [Myxococcota bacterium]